MSIRKNIIRTVAVLLAPMLAALALADLASSIRDIESTVSTMERYSKNIGDETKEKLCDYLKKKLDDAKKELEQEKAKLKEARKNPPRSDNAQGGITAGWAKYLNDWAKELDNSERRLADLEERIKKLCPAAKGGGPAPGGGGVPGGGGKPPAGGGGKAPAGGGGKTPGEPGNPDAGGGKKVGGQPGHGKPNTELVGLGLSGDSRRIAADKLPSDSPAVQDTRQQLIRRLIKQLQELAGEGGPMEGSREVYLAIIQLRGFLSDNTITDQEWQRAKDIRKQWIAN
jgi:hypothetical protein